MIPSAETLGILCARCVGGERKGEGERERERELQGETDGSDVTIVALKLAMSLHFPLPKIRTFRFSLLTWSPLWCRNLHCVHTFRSQKNSHSLYRLSRMARQMIEDPRQMIEYMLNTCLPRPTTLAKKNGHLDYT